MSRTYKAHQQGHMLSRGYGSRLMIPAPMSAEKSARLAEYAQLEHARQRETDAMIFMGWGNTERDKIPADWQERPGPDKSAAVYRKIDAKAISALCSASERQER